jgi:hypothetical protein
VSALSNSSVQFSASTYTVNESAGVITLTATRIGNATKPATVNYATVDVTARNATDYIGASGTLQFAPGETFKQFQIGIVDDSLVETTKDFKVVLSLPTGGVIQGSPFTANIDILDDDRPLLLADENTGRAIALSSVSNLAEPFTLLDTHNLSTDQRTRIMLFTSGTTDNDLALFSATAIGPNNRVYPLVIEDVRTVPGFDWLSQVLVRLPDSVDSVGDFAIMLNYRGHKGNMTLIKIQ